MSREFHFEAIGELVSGGGDYRQQSPRQGALADQTGVIELYPGRNFEAALEDLAGAEYIWLVYVFDRSANWRPKVLPPFGDRRIGVFATRSPYRPNPIGLSAVKLLAVEGRKLHIAGHDLLNGTPILDIKPYLADADAHVGAALPWRDRIGFTPRRAEYSALVLRQLDLLEKLGAPDLRKVVETQLALRAPDERRQRLGTLADGRRFLAFRTWRIVYELPDDAAVVVTKVFSGYTAEELAPDAPDPYGDKAIHRAYRAEFPDVSAGDGAAETLQRDEEEQRADGEHLEEDRPHDRDPGSPE